MATDRVLGVGRLSSRAQMPPYRRKDFRAKRLPAAAARREVLPTASRPHHETGGEIDHHDLILKLLPLVKKMALQMRERLPLHVELDDLVSTGALGLVDAVRKFDSRKEVKLESYARHRIRGAMLDGLRGVDSASRDMRKKEKKAERAYRTLELRLGRPPSDPEIADALGITLTKWYRTARELQAVGFDWLRPMSSVSAKDLKEVGGDSLPADSRDNQLEQCYRREQRDLLHRALARLSERERRLVQLYYDRDLTMRQIGSRLGIDESRVSQLHSAVMARLRSRINQAVRYPRPALARLSW